MSEQQRRPGPYPPEVRERAVRMVFEHQAEYPSQWKAIESISKKLSVNHETLRQWVRRAETDAGQRPGLTSDERVRMRQLEREVKELRRANSFEGGVGFLRGGARPPTSVIVDFIATHRARFGVEPICKVLSEHGCKIAPNTFWVARKRPPSKRAGMMLSWWARSVGSTPTTCSSMARTTSGPSSTGKGSVSLAAPWSG
jgi:putative transposase